MAFLHSPGCPCCQCDNGVCVRGIACDGNPIANAPAVITYRDPAPSNATHTASGTTDSTGLFCAPNATYKGLLNASISVTHPLSCDSGNLYPTLNQCGCGVYAVNYPVGGLSCTCPNCGNSGVPAPCSQETPPSGSGGSGCQPIILDLTFCPPTELTIQGYSTFDQRPVPTTTCGWDQTYSDCQPTHPGLWGCYPHCGPSGNVQANLIADQSTAPIYKGRQSCWGIPQNPRPAHYLQPYPVVQTGNASFSGCQGAVLRVAWCDCIADCSQPYLCGSFNNPTNSKVPPCMYPGTFKVDHWDYGEPDTMTWTWNAPQYHRFYGMPNFTLHGIPNPNANNDPFAPKYAGYTSSWVRVNHFTPPAPQDQTCLNNTSTNDCVGGYYIGPDFYFSAGCCRNRGAGINTWTCGVCCAFQAVSCGGISTQTSTLCSMGYADINNQYLCAGPPLFTSWVKVNADLCGMVQIAYYLGLTSNGGCADCPNGSQIYNACANPSPCSTMVCVCGSFSKVSSEQVRLDKDGQQIIGAYQDPYTLQWMGSYLADPGNLDNQLNQGGPASYPVCMDPNATCAFHQVQFFDCVGGTPSQIPVGILGR